MDALKYTVIKSEKQYYEYCNTLELLTEQKSEKLSDKIELLTLLIEKWDSEHNSFIDLNPVELLNALLSENGLKPKDLAGILGLSKGTISKMLNYQKGLSKATIRKLSEYFKITQEAFNRPYELSNRVNRSLNNASV